MANFIDSIKDADTGEQYSIIPAIKLSVDDDFKLTVTLENPSTGEVLRTSDTIDLPIESMITNAEYDSNSNKIVLILQNGNTIDVPIEDAPSGSGGAFTTDETLDLSEDGVLSVNTTNTVGDSELPITAKAVYEILGDINTLLNEI